MVRINILCVSIDQVTEKLQKSYERRFQNGFERKAKCLILLSAEGEIRTRMWKPTLDPECKKL